MIHEILKQAGGLWKWYIGGGAFLIAAATDWWLDRNRHDEDEF